MNISTMHWTYNDDKFNLFLAADFTLEEVAKKEKPP
jgi:hypothetical protein